MKFILFFFLYWACLPCLLIAQSGIKGYTRNVKGEAIPFVSIYVKNLQTGTVSNEDAFYELRLAAGKYQIVFQEMGHKTIEKEITVGENMQTLDITLDTQDFELKEVALTGTREDPAYTIMRKAIAMSKIHKLEVDSYKATIYMKGTGKLINIPDIIQKKMEKEGAKEGQIFLNEAVTELKFEQPNKYTKKVLSSRSSEMADGNSISPMDFIEGSFYDEKLNGIISPLAPSAFAYYRFEWEASFKDQGYEVNKIKVIPRSKGDDVWEGYIYIVEDKWCIHSLQMKTTKLKFEIEAQQTYAPIKNGVFMPITHQFKIGGKIFGFKGEYNYLVSSSEYEITVNPKYNQQFKLIDEKIDREKAKLAQKAREEKAKQNNGGKEQNLETALLNGDELTRKNLRKLIKESEKQEREQYRQKTKKGEIPEDQLVKNDFVTIDSLARKRAKDDDFWAKSRTISLTEEEKNAYRQRDSTIVADSVKRTTEAKDSTSKKKNKEGKFKIGHTLFGGDYKAGKHGRFFLGSILGQLNYNTVEGFASNLKLAYQYQRKKVDFKITGWGRYATSRELFTGKGELQWNFKKKYKYDNSRFRTSTLLIDGGRFIEQFNTAYPIPMFMNSLYTLLFEQNYMKLYEREYARVRWNSTLSEKIAVTSSLEFARRQGLENKADYRTIDWKEREFTPNAPENAEVAETSFPTHNALVFEAKLTYLPALKYGKRNGFKYVVSDKSPVLTLDYRRGMLDVNYDLLTLGIQHQFDWGIRSKIGYAFSAGAFLNKQTMYFPDFKHFNGNRIFIQFSDPVASFRLMDYYRYSSMDKFAVGHAYIKLRKFLFTQIPIFYITGIRENIFVNQLFTPKTSYTETGYALDGILRVFRIEGIASFENGKYRDWGIRVGLTTTFGLSVNGD